MGTGAPLDIEEEAWEDGLRRVAGLDEAGRGPLAGPVVTAAVVLSPGQSFEGATDSKQLSPRRREELCARIRGEALACSLGAASTREIERMNVLRATSLAMRRALADLGVEPDHLLVDGRGIPEL
ncbi:MAG: ribonuclease HII, partial [Gemmatimonadota bacterium]